MKEIIFAKPTGFSLCNEAEGIVKRGDRYYALTTANNLVYQITGSEKKVINLTHSLSLPDDESLKCLQAMDESTFLVVTSKFNVYSFSIDYCANLISNVKVLPFKFGSSLKGGLPIRLCVNKSLLIISSGRFLFYFSSKENQFKILKLLNEDVLAIRFGKDNDDRVFILTHKTISVLSLVKDGGTLILKLMHKESVANPLALAKVGECLVVLDTSRYIRIYDIETQSWRSKFALVTSTKELIEVIALSVCSEDRLIAFSDKYAFVLRKGIDKVTNILIIKEFDYIALDDDFLKFERSSDHLSTIATIKSETYTEENKHTKFYQQTPDNQLSILLSFMSKQFLKQKQIQSAKDCVESLLNRLQLRSSVYHLSQFKKTILLFCSLIKDFTTMSRSSAPPVFSVIKPRIVSISDGGDFYQDYRTPKKQSEFPTPFSRRRISDATDRTPRISFEDFQVIEQKWDQEASHYHNESSFGLVHPKNV